MIFCSKNEKGEPAWKLVLEGRKTVTRRLKPLAVGKEFAVQSGRGKKAICRARVLSCIRHNAWISNLFLQLGLTSEKAVDKMSSLEANAKKLALGYYFIKEAKREGFKYWHKGLLPALKKMGVDIDKTWRIEFLVIK